MKKNEKITQEINQEIDKYVAELKQMLEDNYNDSTMAQMEWKTLDHVQDIAKAVLSGYIKKKMLNSSQLKRL